MKRTKFQQKVWLATKRRKQEQAVNRRRAAWNRVGDRFGLSKQDLVAAKNSGLSPYRLLRDPAATRESAQTYIDHGRTEEVRFESWAEFGMYLEMEKLVAEAADDLDYF
jgi:hypothetical protein